MYRTGKDYNGMAQLVIDIYLDYGIKSLPIDVMELCKKLGVLLIPYSELNDDYRRIAMVISKDAFYIPPTPNSNAQIYYNDTIQSNGKIRYSIIHELKHYVCNEMAETKYNEDMAEYFARYFLAPIPYLVIKGITSTVDIMSLCGLSQTAAENAAKNVKRRINTYGNRIFDYEKPLIEQLYPDDYFKVDF